MAQHAMEAAEKYAPQPDPADQADLDALASGKGDADESKFASLTAALMVRKRPAPAWASSAAEDLRTPPEGETQTALAGRDFLVRKGEASPSLPLPIARVNARRDEELGGLRAQCERLQTDLASREADLASAQADIAEMRELWQQETDNVLGEAEAAWKKEAAQHFAEAEAEWRVQSAASLAETKTAVDEAGSKLLQLRGECAGLKGALANCQLALAQTQTAAEAERERLRLELQRAMADERAAAETARHNLEHECGTLQQMLAASEGRLKETRHAAEEAEERCRSAQEEAERTRHALARLQSETHTVRDDETSELLRLRTECEAVQQRLTERDAELECLHESMRDEAEETSKEAVLQAETLWKANASRLAVAEAEWKKRAARELADATARAEAAERALAQLRIRNSARDAGDNAEIVRLRDELTALQANAATGSHVSWEPDASPAEGTPIILRTTRDWDRLAQMRRVLDERSRKPAAGILAIGFLLAVLVTRYLGIDPFGLHFSLPNLPGVVATAPSPSGASAVVVAAQTGTATAVLSHTANLRSGPAMTAAVISSLAGGAQVVPVEQSGNWTLVHVSGQGDGWVYSAFLEPQERTPAPKTK